MQKLNLGCGLNIMPGCINLDREPYQDVDVAHEIRSGISLPFVDDTFDEIFMIDLVEHVQDIPWLFSEAHRVGKDNAPVIVQYPHFSDVNSYNDATHYHHLGVRAFDHFIPGTGCGDRYRYYNLFGRNFPFSLKNTELTFRVRGSEYLYRIFGMDVYERHISRSLPISNVKLELSIIKK